MEGIIVAGPKASISVCGATCTGRRGDHLSNLSAIRAKFLFILGFEKCGTTALAGYLVEQGVCAYLVEGIKESEILYRDATIAKNLLSDLSTKDSRPIWLGASVGSIHRPEAIACIRDHASDYRAIICMRNPFERMVSAYRFYRDVNSTPCLNDSMYAEIMARTGITVWNPGAKLANGTPAPGYLKEPFDAGHYFYSILNNRCEPAEKRRSAFKTYDACVADFHRRSLPQQIRFEYQHWAERKMFPPLSVTANSYYSEPVAQAVAMLDPSRIMLITPRAIGRCQNPGKILEAFLNLPAHAFFPDQPLPRRNEAQGQELSSVHLEMARHFVADNFENDARDLLRLVASNRALNVDFFDPAELLD